ncbi:ABC transporter substrate-binding protein [Alteribacillus sp. JSM 102045]|uniref:ABC transporter substrate-binding protein n=1 Tax=Alteribacillus sp. JSM 102045 TaxID=1562101 RepID=UPI0035BFA855
MKQRKLLIKIRVVIIGIVLFLGGCREGDEGNEEPVEAHAEKTWDEIVEEAEGTEVHFYMWGGDEGNNRYIDDWVAPRLKEQYDITLKRYPMDTTEFLQKLQTEKRAGNSEGVMDIVWINGENFKNAKEHGLLWGSFTEYLPNVKEYVGSDRSDVQYDFGTPIEGMEAPWGKVQYVFFYDSAKVDEPPRNFTELAEWVKESPGTFTYPEAQAFNGSGFLKHLLYAKIGVEELQDKEFDENLAEEHAGEIWGYLNDIEPHLWKNGETYPATMADLDHLYSQGEVLFTMGYNEARAERLIEEGIFPETTKSFIMEPGSIGNLHFLSIPFNSPNTAGAMVAINDMLSPEAQLEKMKPAVWGENTVLDIDALPESYQESFTTIKRGASVLPADELEENYLNEMDPEYIGWIKENWLSEVLQTTSNETVSSPSS